MKLRYILMLVYPGPLLSQPSTYSLIHIILPRIDEFYHKLSSPHPLPYVNFCFKVAYDLV